MKKKDLIVFDIDGTITDTVEMHQQAFIGTLRYFGIENFNSSFGNYKHHTDSHILKTIIETNTKLVFNSLFISRFERQLHALMEQYEIKEIAGAKQFIQQVETQTSYGICYATGSLLEPARLKLKCLGISYEVTQLVASNEIEEREHIIRKAIENAKKHYNVEHFGRILLFGDGLWDLKTAENLSLEFIGVGNKNEQILRKNGMTRHFPNLENINLTEL